MAITNGYCTLDELRGWVGITDSTDRTDDFRLELAIEAASRQIDRHCHRRFYPDTADATRYYTARYSDWLRVPDLISVTTLATDPDLDRDYDDTWATTDYLLEPANAATDSEPYTAIRKTALGGYDFPLDAKAVKIVGKFGWPAVPDPIKAATMIYAARLFKRKDVVMGTLGTPEVGMVTLPAMDPDERTLIAPYIVRNIMGAL